MLTYIVYSYWQKQQCLTWLLGYFIDHICFCTAQGAKVSTATAKFDNNNICPYNPQSLAKSVKFALGPWAVY